LPTASIKELPEKLTSLFREKKKDDNVKLSLLPIREMHFESDLQRSFFEHSNKKVVLIFAVLGILLLLIACINYVNLSTSKGIIESKRSKCKKDNRRRQGSVVLTIHI
jgi:hypothetical protein